MPANPLSNEQLADSARLKALFRKWQERERSEGRKISQEDASESLGFGQSALSQYLNGKIPLNVDAATKIADLIGVAIADFSDDLATKGAKYGAAVKNKVVAIPEHLFLESARRYIPDFELESAEDTNHKVGKIEYWDVRGSCGGGFLNYDQMPKGHLVKERTFFQKYKLIPENAFAIYADGDSMADFIVDGDIVIFDRSKTEPKSGKIFAIEHPEGLRIKQLRRAIDGAWILECKNPDKRAYPDERIPSDFPELLKICGEFVYRQGGY